MIGTVDHYFKKNCSFRLAIYSSFFLTIFGILQLSFLITQNNLIRDIYKTMPGNLIEKELTYLFSSSPLYASNIRDQGSTFDVILDRPVAIPKEAVYATVEIRSSSIPWTIPNISSFLGNNQFIINDNGTPYNLVIPDGLYSLDTLANTIARELQNAGGDPSIISFLADSATQRVVIAFNSANVVITFSANTMYEILGWNLNDVVTAPIDSSVTAPNVAQFNQITSFIITSNLVSNGIPVNNTFAGVLANILILVPPGSINNVEPYNPQKVDASQLIGKVQNQITFRLRDQLNRIVEISEEVWNFVLVIKYYVRAGGLQSGNVGIF
jgi:hypothetical protein